MNLIVSRFDNSIFLDGKKVSNIKEEYLSFIPSDVFNFYWYNTYGEIQYFDNTMKIVKELGIYEQCINIFNVELKKVEDGEGKEKLENASITSEKTEEIQREVEENRNYWQEFREIRDYKLLICDWTQLPNSQLTIQKKELWEEYRQNLRDLPSIIQDPKPLVLDTNNPNWPVRPS